MHPVLQSCHLLLRIVRDLIAGVAHFGYGAMGANEDAQVSDFVATKAAAQRLAAGLRLAEAYLRRVVLVMALELEPTLIDPPQGDLSRRRRDRPLKIVVRCVAFTMFNKQSALPDAILNKMRENDAGKQGVTQIQPICIGPLKARLNNLAKIAADPLPRARRLAFHLARKRPGPMFASGGHIRPSGSLGRLRKLWNTQTSAAFEAMAMNIQTKSRARPPPLPLRHRYGPSILVLGG